MNVRSLAGMGAKATTYGQLAMYAIGAVVLALAIGAGVGGYFGYGWHKGNTAVAANRTLQADIAALSAAVKSAQGATAQISRDASEASASLNRVSKGLSDDLEDNRTNASSVRVAMEQAIARNPAAAGQRADADFMRAWNAANRGDSAGAAGAGDADPAGRRGPDNPVPPATPAGAGQQPGRPGAQSRRERGDVSRLQASAVAIGPGDARTRAAGAGAHRARSPLAGAVTRDG